VVCQPQDYTDTVLEQPCTELWEEAIAA